MKNTVELLGHYGGDETHALSAWTSTSRELTAEKRERIPALLKMLADNKHETPFEKSTLHFLCTTDIATHIHLLKHRIGVSINAESARYKELKEDKAYIPEEWFDVPFGPERGATGWSWGVELEEFVSEAQGRYHQALEELTPILGRKRAKESARYFLPYATQITCDVSFNFRSFAHFCKLRFSPDAQVEIREVAGQMIELVKSQTEDAFKHTMEAFGL